MTRILPLLAWPLLLAGCTTTPVPEEPVGFASEAEARDAHALAQAACGGCHSVEVYGLSPNPDAPEWPQIANRGGLTRETLTTWLVDAHNYPEDMDFYLEEDEVADLVTYMLTLRREGYTPPQ